MLENTSAAPGPAPAPTAAPAPGPIVIKPAVCPRLTTAPVQLTPAQVMALVTLFAENVMLPISNLANLRGISLEIQSNGKGALKIGYVA